MNARWIKPSLIGTVACLNMAVIAASTIIAFTFYKYPNRTPAIIDTAVITCAFPLGTFISMGVTSDVEYPLSYIIRWISYNSVVLISNAYLWGISA